MIEALRRGASILSVIKQFESIVNRLEPSIVSEFASLSQQMLNTWREYLPEDTVTALDYILSGEGDGRERMLAVLANKDSRRALTSAVRQFAPQTVEEHLHAIALQGGVLQTCPVCQEVSNPILIAHNKTLNLTGE